MRTEAILFALTASAAHAFQLPFRLPFLSGEYQTPIVLPDSSISAPQSIPNRIAIVGAGAGGSSAAFWIAKAKERFGLDVEVDVFEKNDYIGGRSTVVYPYGNISLEPVELGASIFVKANKNLWRATEEFELDRVGFEDDDNVMGVWDGSKFRLTTGGGWFFGGWWDKLKIIWRYGLDAPSRTQSIVGSMIDEYLELYAKTAPRFDNITELTQTMGWTHWVAQTTAEFFDSRGIDRRFTRELIEAATRVNYGQNVDSIHALEGLCSLAATGASSVKGGNFQIFEQFLARSGARVHLNTSVTALSQYSKDETSGWLVTTSGSAQPQAYRAVVLAAPFHTSSIALAAPTEMPSIPTQPYVHLHVTLLSTASPAPDAGYFGLLSGTAPTEVLTTWDGVRQGGLKPEFNSLTYHGLIRDKDGEVVESELGKEWVVKIFSEQRIEDAWLEQVFTGKVGWVHRKEWDAYPVLPPTTSFPPIRLAQGLYYVNAFEPFISTMETETLAARNAVDLLLRDEFDSGVCGKSSEAVSINAGGLPADPSPAATNDTMPAKAKASSEFVLGWDC
ncbi:FAD/NAD(P)-binding domain-containing protein [Obba rivulosa]|uniref:FAD/NAD(P)-binding domain-containing protein n=1 Tax=Obba rivulosa TaxID=1052685 RepID=A0A8E2B242_9APHY|nr:FAD/NAD(P)-binding domain-containing protein [Obba rivulosa]